MADGLSQFKLYVSSPSEKTDEELFSVNFLAHDCLPDFIASEKAKPSLENDGEANSLKIRFKTDKDGNYFLDTSTEGLKISDRAGIAIKDGNKLILHGTRVDINETGVVIS